MSRAIDNGYEVHGAQRLIDRNIELFPLALFATDDPIMVNYYMRVQFFTFK